MVTGFHRGWLRRVAAILLCLGTVISAPALAQSPPPRLSGTVSIHQIQVAFIGSGLLGGGTLSYRGAAYRFRLGGLGIGGVGVSRLDATGTVYNLRRLTDFEGVYGQVRSGWAVGGPGFFVDQLLGRKPRACVRRDAGEGDAPV